MMAEQRQCSACGALAPGGDRFCMSCGTQLEPSVHDALDIQRRFQSLRVIAFIFRVLAWISLVLGTIGVLVAASGTYGRAQLFVLLGGAIAVAIDTLVLFAIAAFLHLMLGIEHNTRRTAELLARGEHAAAPA